MDEDEDDLYGTSQSAPAQGVGGSGYYGNGAQVKHEDLEDGEEEGEEIEEDDSDSDIDIITERKPTSRPEPTTQNSSARIETIKAEPSRAVSIDRPAPRVPTATIKSETSSRPPPPQKSGSQYPEVHTSTIDVNAIPNYQPVGKVITDVDIDADLAEHDKPWRRPGADQSDYFNYGFDEFTWTTYCLKQKTMRETINAQKAESAKFEMMFGGAPGMPGMGMPAGPPSMGPGAPNGQQQQSGGVGPQPGIDQAMGGMAAMPGMPDMNPDMMNAMMQQMMQSGVDPSQMDFGTFMQSMQQVQGPGPGAGGPPPAGYGGQGQGGYGSGGGGGGGRRGGRRW